MIGLKKRLLKITLICLVYLIWTYLSDSVNETEDIEIGKRTVETVHANEMRMAMWIRGLKTHQHWMMFPPQIMNKPWKKRSSYFDMSSCSLGLKDGVHKVTRSDLQNCTGLEKVVNGTLTIASSEVSGVASLMLEDGKLCQFIYQGGLLQGMQRIFVNCMQTKYRGQWCLQVVGQS